MNRNPLSNISTNKHNLRQSRKQIDRAVVLSENATTTISKKILKIGRWNESEKLAFLQGLSIHGRGKWKAISHLIPTRSSVQVKSHAQQMMQKTDEGINIFQKLEDFNGKKSTKFDDVISGSPIANSRKDIDAALSLVMMASK